MKPLLGAALVALVVVAWLRTGAGAAQEIALPTPRGQLGGLEDLGETPSAPPAATIPPGPTAPPSPTPETPSPEATATVPSPAPRPSEGTATPSGTLTEPPVSTPSATPIVGGANGEVVPAVAALLPSVVGLEPVGAPGPASAGVIVADGRSVIGAASVIATEADYVAVLPTGGRAPVDVVTVDPASGLAVLRAAAPLGPPALLADVPPSVGQMVVAVGTAYGELPGSLALGVVSSAERAVADGPAATLLIQHDAVVPGGEGGPLAAIDGRVLGIVVSAPDGASVAFAVPVATVRRVVEAVARDGRVAYPYLGAEVRPVESNPGGAPVFAVEVVAVAPGGPAAEAGIEPGDRIVGLGGEVFSARLPFTVALLARSPGEAVDFAISRGDDERLVRVTLGERPAS